MVTHTSQYEEGPSRKFNKGNVDMILMWKGKILCRIHAKSTHASLLAWYPPGDEDTLKKYIRSHVNEPSHPSTRATLIVFSGVTIYVIPSSFRKAFNIFEAYYYAICCNHEGKPMAGGSIQWKACPFSLPLYSSFASKYYYTVIIPTFIPAVVEPC